MAKSATISMRIDGQLKAETETIFQQLGMTTTEAIKIFLAAVRNRKGLPFQVQVVSEQVPALEESYLKLQNSVKVGPGDIPSDIQAARDARLEKYR